MKNRSLACAPLMVAVLLASGNVYGAGKAFFYVDDPDRLPFEPLPPPAGPPVSDTLDVDLIDVDRDGDLDLFYAEGSASAQGFPNRLYINDGNGFFSDESAARLPSGVPANSTEADFADVDCNGTLDAAISNLGPNQLLANDGAGVFTDVSFNLPPTPSIPSPPFVEISAEARFFDVDTDGDPDLFIGNENPFNPSFNGGQQNRLLINDGDCSGVFVEFQGLPSITDQTASVVTGDFDGDGDVDLLVINVGPNYVLLNRLVETGTLGFELSPDAIRPASANTRSSREGALGDLDGDGCIDLYEANSRSQPDAVYLGDCAGGFLLAPDALPFLQTTETDVDLVDLDGDGDLDAFTTSPGGFLGGHGFLGDLNRYFENNGRGVFRERTLKHFPELIDTSTNSEFGDVDGDGDLDLAVGNSGLGPVAEPQGGLDRLLMRLSCASPNCTVLVTAPGR